MELIKSQTKRINKFVKFLSKRSESGSDRYCWRYNIRDNKLWYCNIVVMCELNEEILLKLSKGRIFKTIRNYFGVERMEQFDKEWDTITGLRLEQCLKQQLKDRAEKIALIIEQETEHNKRVELIKELLER